MTVISFSFCIVYRSDDLRVLRVKYPWHPSVWCYRLEQLDRARLRDETDETRFFCRHMIMLMSKKNESEKIYLNILMGQTAPRSYWHHGEIQCIKESYKIRSWIVRQTDRALMMRRNQMLLWALCTFSGTGSKMQLKCLLPRNRPITTWCRFENVIERSCTTPIKLQNGMRNAKYLQNHKNNYVTISTKDYIEYKPCKT